MHKPTEIIATRVAPASMEMISCVTVVFDATRPTAICGGA